MGNTSHYGLGYFDLGDKLGTDYSSQVEISRFLLIDKLLYGLMSVFGNGVISGWVVSQSDSFSVSVGEGYGNINYFACRSLAPTVLSLSPNVISHIYARSIPQSRYDQSTEFFVSTSLIDIENTILLATVTTDTVGVVSIDNSVRDEIAFIDLIKSLIAQHHHRGGTLDPSKIDLASEVKGQLPSFRIADFDASKITTGTFDLARIPLMDHSDLLNSGLLTHPELDTFVQTLEATNKELFGEIGTVTMLQMLLAMKYIYDDPDSPFYFATRTVDHTMVNELALIPGITPNGLIDFDNTTATVNLVDHYISGIAAATGSSFYVTYDTDLNWRSAYSRSNLVIGNDQVSLAYDESNDTTYKVIENFETATAQGEVLSGSGKLFEQQDVTLTNNAEITATNQQTFAGYWAGKFQYTQSFRGQFIKQYSTPQDWSEYDSFVMHVKCSNQNHGSVKLYFVNSKGDLSAETIVLESGEVTSDPDTNGFKLILVDLTSISFNNDIASFVIYTDDLVEPFTFVIDYITLQKAMLLPPSGQMVLRYSSNSLVTFSQIEWNSVLPTGTTLSVRARAASSAALLTRAAYTPYLISGNLINLSGTDIEIEITFESNTERTLGPVLELLRLLVLSPSSTDEGLTIDTEAEFARGESQNVTVDATTLVSLTSPVSVGSYYFMLDNVGNQIYDDGTYVKAEIPIFGSKTPIAPNQIFRAVEENIKTVSAGNFGYPRSIMRTVDRTFVIADTYNDRVLELNEDLEVVNGFGSINYRHGSKVFPLAASADIRSGILYVIWSQPIPLASVTVSHISIRSGSTKIQLVNDSDLIADMTTEEVVAANQSSQILPIYLSAQNAVLVAALTSAAYLTLGSNVIAGGYSTDSEFYKKIKTSQGIPCFIGNFAYIDGVFTPTYANKNESTFMVCNGTLGVKEFVFPATAFPGGAESLTLSTAASSIIEVLDNVVGFASNVMNFSPFIPGRAERIDSETIIAGGIKPGGTDKKDKLTFRTLDGTKIASQKSTLKDVFFGSEKPCSGAVTVYDTENQASLFEYFSPEGLLVSDVDVKSDTYVVAESSFGNSGRVIEINLSGDITSSLGEGTYGIIAAARVEENGNMVLST